MIFKLYLLVPSADSFCIQFGPRSGHTFWIHTVLNSDGIPKIFFKKSPADKKACKITQIESKYRLRACLGIWNLLLGHFLWFFCLQIFHKMNFIRKFFNKCHDQNVNQFAAWSGPTLYWTWPGFKQFAKSINSNKSCNYIKEIRFNFYDTYTASVLIHKVPPIICSRGQFQMLPLFQIRHDIS